MGAIKSKGVIPSHHAATGEVKGTIPPNVLFAVADEKSAANHVSIPLEDCFDCPEWRALVTQCNHKLFLVASTFEEYHILPNAKVLSYRWKDVVTVECSVTIPGMTPSAPRSCTFCADAFHSLQDFSSGYLWIDYLCHMNDSAHKIHVMGQMGSLYWKGEALPAYLLNVDMKETDGHVSGCIDEEYIRYIRVQKQSSDSLLALRRGWIQQEIGFGRLDVTVVKDFVTHCLAQQYYGVLGTLIRRRACAMKWVFKSKNEEDQSLLFLDTTAEDVHQGKQRLLGKSSSSGGVSVDVQNAIRDIISAQLLQVAPDLHARLVSAGKEQRTTLSEKFHKLHTEEAEAAKKADTFFNHSDELSQLISQVWDLDQKHCFDLDLCGPDCRDEAITAIQPFLTELTSKLCVSEAFNPSDFFCAFQLLKSFGESELTYESDTSCALTQVAAVSAGMEWVTGKEGELSGTSLTLLRKCWVTVFKHIKTHKLFIQIGIIRKNLTEKTLGLTKFLSFFQTNEHKNDEIRRKKAMAYYRCGDVLVQVRNDEIRVTATKESPEARRGQAPVVSVRKIDHLFAA